MEQVCGSGCKILPEIAVARGWSDGAQTLGDGRYGADDYTCGGGEMDGAARTRWREVELAGKSFVSPARGGA